eukprot:sb/3478969/
MFKRKSLSNNPLEFEFELSSVRVSVRSSPMLILSYKYLIYPGFLPNYDNKLRPTTPPSMHIEVEYTALLDNPPGFAGWFFSPLSTSITRLPWQLKW